MVIDVSGRQPLSTWERLHLSRDWDPILVYLWKQRSGDSPSLKVTNTGARASEAHKCEMHDSALLQGIICYTIWYLAKRSLGPCKTA